MGNDVHTYDAPGSIVCRALHSKHIDEGGSVLRSKHAAPRTKEPYNPSIGMGSGQLTSGFHVKR